MGNIHTSRNTISTTLNTAPYSISVWIAYPRIPASTYGSCRPISRNTIPFRAKFSACQTLISWMRASGENIRPLRWLRKMPQATTLNTPDARTSSPSRYAT